MARQRMTKPAITRGRSQVTSQSDWERIDGLSDEDIDYSDAPELGSDFWATAKVLDPGTKRPITIRIDQDVIAWFKSRGGRYQVLMNKVLRSYMENLDKHGQGS